jgi:hypothetical protein
MDKYLAVLYSETRQKGKRVGRVIARNHRRD